MKPCLKRRPTKEGSISEYQDNLGGISRRRIIQASFGAVAAPAVLRVIPANAQSRVIKIGYVNPRTGPLAGFGEADTFIIDQVKGIVGKGIQSGGKTYPIEIIARDSQSTSTREKADHK